MVERERRRSRAIRWVGALFLAMVLYVGSWGLVAALYDADILHNPAPVWVVTFYGPIHLLEKHEPFKTPLRAWWHLWARVLKTH